jgi:hypothetical protein
MTEQHLCTSFTRRHKGKGRPQRDAVCGVCDATYSEHHPKGEALPALAKWVRPAECGHFTKTDKKRGKPSPSSFCAVCEVVWTDHSPRGSESLVLHPDAIRPQELALSPKVGSRLPQPAAKAPTVARKLTKVATDTPAPVEPVVLAVEPVVEPVEAPEPPAEAFEEPTEEPREPGRFLAWMDAQHEEDISAYMAQGLTREQAEAKVEDDNDW